MKLLKLSYKDPNWELNDLELDSVNLIVAQNSTGKTRTLLFLDLLVQIITQKSYFIDRVGGYWSTEFQNKKGKKINYFFSTIFDNRLQQLIIEEEKLIVDDLEVLICNKNGAWDKNILANSDDIVYPPKNKLVLHTNRDVKKYPYLEEIANWAENSYGFMFANIMPPSKVNLTFGTLLNTIEDFPELFNSLNENSHKSIITQLNSIGYNISQITADDNGDSIILFIEENGINRTLSHNVLSQGMFRALSIIIFIEYLISNKKPAMVIVDDLCEGLDYERAKKLGELIFNKCLHSDIQLVATSNDVFLMDVVDIKHWNILMRTGKVVTALNNKNNPKIFTDFRFTGLSNFDFFSSDFLKQELK